MRCIVMDAINERPIRACEEVTIVDRPFGHVSLCVLIIRNTIQGLLQRALAGAAACWTDIQARL